MGMARDELILKKLGGETLRAVLWASCLLAAFTSTQMLLPGSWKGKRSLGPKSLPIRKTKIIISTDISVLCQAFLASPAVDLFVSAM